MELSPIVIIYPHKVFFYRKSLFFSKWKVDLHPEYQARIRDIPISVRVDKDTLYLRTSTLYLIVRITYLKSVTEDGYLYVKHLSEPIYIPVSFVPDIQDLIK